MGLLILDIGMRGASASLLVVLVILIWMSRVGRESQIAFSIFTASTLARIWSNLPPSIEMHEGAIYILRNIGTAGAFSVTWFMLTIFLDSKRFKSSWLISGALISFGVFLAPYFRDFLPLLRIYAALHFAALLVLLIYTAKDDIVDARRRLRPALATTVLIFCIGQALTSTQMVGSKSAVPALVHAFSFTVCIFLFVLWVLKADTDKWPGDLEPELDVEPNLTDLNAAQAALIARIKQAMDGGIWRQEGLTVSALALEVKAPEHRVRKAINQVLGYRNFAAYVNQSRIDAAKARLLAPEDVETTILEIAFSVGFASLGPFNRAFRQATGQSPTEFRKGEA